MSALIHAVGVAGWALGTLLSRNRLTVLTYHGIPAAYDPLALPEQVTARVFDEQMGAVAKHFNVLPLPEAVQKLNAGTLPPKALAITFDDGYLNNFEIALPILQRHRLTATFFICSGYLDGGLMFNDLITEAVRHTSLGEFQPPDDLLGGQRLALNSIPARAEACRRLIQSAKYLQNDERQLLCERIWHGLIGTSTLSATSSNRPQLTMSSEHVRQLHQQGMTIGGHSHTHPILARCTPDQTRSELQINRDILHGIIGEAPQVFAYPNGRAMRDFDRTHRQIVADVGYSCAVTTEMGICCRDMDALQLPRFAPWDIDADRLLYQLGKNALRGTTPKLVS
jgi:peptidoglycan/xylan/chitin deacetylase (PgdA/CDA1 family)